MTTQNCPYCNEENPGEAVMCWACYTPLGAARNDDLEPQLPLSDKSVGAKVVSVLGNSAPLGAMAGLVASGWLPRAARLPVLGASPERYGRRDYSLLDGRKGNRVADTRKMERA